MSQYIYTSISISLYISHIYSVTGAISVCSRETNHTSDKAKYMHLVGNLKFAVSAKLLWIISAKLMPSMSMPFMCLDQYKYGYSCMN